MPALRTCPKCGESDTNTTSRIIQVEGRVAFCTSCGHDWRLDR